MNEDLKKKLEGLMHDAVMAGEIPFGNLLVRKDGEELCYLEQGVERDAIFRLYSLTKPITSAAVMKLMEQGKLLYSDEISKYLQGFIMPWALSEEKVQKTPREVTIRDLMNMTSGLVYGDYPGRAGRDAKKVFDEIDKRLFTDHALTTVEAANLFGIGVLSFAPGESWNYGTSADILGAIVEIVSGMSFGEFLQKEFFEPLEMEDTGFFVEEDKRKRLVRSYKKTEIGFEFYTGNYLGIINAMDRKPAFESGGAGLCSTIDDYSHFADMLMEKGIYKGRRILNERTVEFMTSPKLNAIQKKSFGSGVDNPGYSYGNLMRILEEPGLASILGSAGEYGWDGWLGTYFCNSPKERMTVLFMTQRTDSGWLPVTKRIKNVLFGEYGVLEGQE
ncbi:MAG: beta-lactamase family protein [Roseburia sp.]|nr:beta-lactamase family protein [Roseburia sp.]